MINFQSFSRQWLAWMLDATWQVALFVAVIALIAWAARGAAPRFRHALWLLVLVKALLPPGLAAPWSVGHWLVPRLTASSRWAQFLTTHEAVGIASVSTESKALASSAIDRGAALSPRALLLGWTAGVLVFALAVGWRYYGVRRMIRIANPIDEGPVRVALERVGLELGLRRLPDIYATGVTTSPFLFRVRQPCIVLPERQLSELSATELEAVLTHELMHFKHCDTWVGWLQVLVQGLFWFHPLVWWANRQLRHERERVCDESVLRLGQLSPQSYGESIVRVLTASRGQSLVSGSLVGVFERGVKLYDRLESIMKYEPRKREFGWQARLCIAALAICLLPMGRRAAQSAPAATSDPQIVKTMPAVGATDVDPALKEITVTFDRDMGKGMSWTGGPPEFPPVDESRKAQWRDGRTCVLPVKLQPGSMYRVGINSTSYQNFQSADGVAAKPSVIYFTTQGAGPEVKQQLRAPQITSMEPKNGAVDVDPKISELKVTFDMPMGEGFSWTGGEPSFPKIPDGKKPSWSADAKTCTLPVALEPGKEYQLGLNSASHKNFQSKSGVPLAPVVYKFKTRDAK